MMLDPHTLARMEGAGDGPILVALSGGGDSTALLHLLAEELGASRLIAGVVDHALRAGSADDARRAAASAEALGVRAHVLTLTWADGENRSQAAARGRRYRALSALAREVGARVIATGHNRDDQAETVLMRAARGGGWRGLAGMRAFAPVPVWPEGRGLWLARPLLGARREDLRDWLRARGVAWIEDPANANERYERVAARNALAREGDSEIVRLAAIAERSAPLAAALDERALALIESAARFAEDEIELARGAWEESEAVRERALGALIVAASGEANAPTPAQLQTLVSQMADAQFSGATLGGAQVRRGADGFVITRDTGALTGRADGARPIAPLPLAPGVETVWDGRVALTARGAGWSVVYENGLAQLALGDERAALAAAAPHWLLKDRVRHFLGAD